MQKVMIVFWNRNLPLLFVMMAGASTGKASVRSSGQVHCWPEVDSGLGWRQDLSGVDVVMKAEAEDSPNESAVEQRPTTTSPPPQVREEVEVDEDKDEEVKSASSRETLTA